MRPLLVLLVLTTFATPSAAQDNVALGIWANVPRGERVRLLLTDGSMLSGRMAGGARDSIWIIDSCDWPHCVGPAGTAIVARGLIAEAVQCSRATGAGAVIGGVTTAVVSAVLLFVAVQIADPPAENPAGRVLAATALFGSGGAVVGAAVGSRFCRWRAVSRLVR